MSIRLLPTPTKATTNADLYELDETAWLETMADLIERGAVEDLDLPHLGEYLSDMARRDRREVESRLAVLIAHILKWEHLPDHRSASWRGTIVDQRLELSRLVERGVLRAHAESQLADAYAEGVERAVAETGLPVETFPNEPAYTLDELLSFDPTAE
jgi:Domain of unknown function DUF29